MNLLLRIKYWLIKLSLFKHTFHLQEFVHVDKHGASTNYISDRIKWLEDVEVHCRYKDLDKNALAILHDKYTQYKGYIKLFLNMKREEEIRIAQELLSCGALSKEACDAIKADFPELAESEPTVEEFLYGKPVELDDETLTNLDRALCIVSHARGVLPMYQTDDGIYECDKAIETLKRIMENGFRKPEEWSEEEEYVDLGLSVKWATRNVGADSPEEYGDYYTFDEAKKLDVQVPTNEQWKELQKKCEWEWKGNGYRIIGKNGNSIFLPAAGYRIYGYLFNAGSYGNYLSSSLSTGYPYCAWGVFFYSSNVSRSSYYRYYGLSVRPVSE